MLEGVEGRDKDPYHWEALGDESSSDELSCISLAAQRGERGPLRGLIKALRNDIIAYGQGCRRFRAPKNRRYW